MKLTLAQAAAIIEKNPNKRLVALAQKQHKRARLHMYGEGIESHLTEIKGFEKPFMKQLRVSYVQSNRDIFARLRKPIDKVYTARGGSSYFNLGAEGNLRAQKLKDNVRKGFSLDDWNYNFWRMHFLDDPMGLIFMEVGKDGNSYPTYKASTRIFDYKPDGGTGFEYVIFEVGKDEQALLGVNVDKKVFRIVDDAKDRLVTFSNERSAEVGQEGSFVVEEIPEHTYKNPFGHVPARTISGIVNPADDGFVSIFEDIFSLADAYLLEMSMKLVHKFRHAFAKYWERADDCGACKGKGKVEGKTCKDCQGYGKKIMLNVSDVKLVDYPTKDAPDAAPNLGGYIEPSKIYYEIAQSELADLEEKMTMTVWGSKTTTRLKQGVGLSLAKNGSATATEVMDNRQPEIENIRNITKQAQSIDKFVMDHMITTNLDQPNYIRKGGCSINRGTRYLIEEPDALIERLINARKEGTSPTILYGMYEEYLEAKYASDGVSLNLHKKLMQVEPFMFYTLSEMVMQQATPEEIRLKRYWPEWLTNMPNEKMLWGTVGELRTAFEAFCQTKPLPVPPEPKEAPAKKPATKKATKQPA